MIGSRGLQRRPIAIAMLAAALAACSGSPSPSGTAGSPSGSGVGPGTATAAPSIGGGGGPGSIAVGPGDFTLLEFASQLDQLASYRARLTKTFKGTSAGQAKEWSVVAELVHRDDPLENALTVETTGEPAESPGQIYERGGVLYAVAPGLECVASAGPSSDLIRARAELAALLPGVIGAVSAGTATVDGAETDHYTFDERALGLAGIATASGELWTATGGGHLVAYKLTTRGGPDYFGPDTTGVATWDYELRDGNASLSIDVPASCPGGLVPAPAMPDATTIVSAPGVLIYSTASDLAGVIRFYTGSAADLGWTRLNEPLVDKTIGVLEYSSPAGAVTVFVNSTAGTTTVRIVVDPAGGT